MILIALGAGSALRAELFWRGDANDDATYDLSDAIFTFSYLFLGGESPRCLDAVDSNDDGVVDLSDGVFTLNFLFKGGAPIPTPAPSSACPGRDPTPDGLSCDSDRVGSARPEASLYLSTAFAPGVRQRSRDGVGVEGPRSVDLGVAFTIVLEARSNPDTTSPFELTTGDPPEGDPRTFAVVCDRDLGDPAAGGIARGTNLAPWFSREIRPWRDDIYLLEHHVFRISGDDTWRPSAGEYRFTAVVSDLACGVSEETSLVVIVSDVDAPEFFVFLERPDGDLVQHQAGSGQARLDPDETYRLVVDAGDSDVVLDSFRAGSTPALGGESDITDRFAREERRWTMSLAPQDVPAAGDIDVTVSLSDAVGFERERRFVLEVPVTYSASVQPIFDLNCTGCHERPDPFQGLEIVGRESERMRLNIVNVFAAQPAIDSTAPLLVRPYSVRQSYLVHKLRGTHLDGGVHGRGDRMPRDGGFLDDAALRLIESWITQGAE